LDFCYECDTYPNCKEFRVLADHSLKYGESLAENLEKIKVDEVEEWLERNNTVFLLSDHISELC